ncbi:MAG: hypothetical protein RJA13_2235 [Bacteroidota bacterium]|jgi:RHS repeat-associated protein
MIRPSNRASIRNISDYSPFGVQLSERTISGDGYRFGFNGMEGDDEIKGDGNFISFKYRNYDPRIGRMWSIDPLTSKYPFYTPYSFSGNRVIDCKELEGLEPLSATTIADGTYRPAFNINLPNGAAATLFVHGGTYAITPQDRALIASFPEFDVKIGDNYPPSYTAQTGKFGINVIAGVGGVSRQTGDAWTQELFRSTQLTGPSTITQTISVVNNIASTVVTPNNQDVGGFQVVNQNTTVPMPLSQNNQAAQANAVNSQFGAINTAVNGILSDPSNTLTNINIPYNPNVSNGTLNALQQQTQQLQTQYPNANISLTPDNTLGASVVTNRTSIGFNTTTQQVTQQVTKQTQTVPTMTTIP